MADKKKNLQEIEAELRKNLPPGQSQQDISKMAKKIFDEGQKRAK
ncbi:hypothetical protein ACFP47_10245 [Nesterenkonia lacusekhoensis]|uniref:Uncharacterized protein n=1 Tax=Nesterenkonia lacusekhoensis TaxID=150832 RepID=A0ABS4T5M1_9MICC|nr:hypothetical protein [Nesterenkonia lacusekhoensis]MBP2319581.1 hypothetical protein [Nesterenkonia lacusekhoensis]